MSVHGLVVDAGIGAEPGHGRPAANVTVRCKLMQPSAPADSSGEPQPTKSAAPVSLSAAGRSTVEIETATDANGQFQIELPADAALVAVTATGDDFMRAARWDAAEGSSQPPEQFVLTRYPHGQLQGIVAEPSGTPVPGARVTITHRKDGERVALETSADQNGYFVLTPGSTESWLHAECDGFLQVAATDPQPLPRGGWQPARILLAPAGTLNIEIVDQTGRPARDVRNVAVALGKAEMALIAVTNCTQGHFRGLAPVVHGRATITVPAEVQLLLLAGETQFARERDGQAVASDADAQMGQPIVVGAGEQHLLRLTIDDLEVRGTVLDPHGRTVADADIYFETVQNGRLASIRLETTDARGQFAVHLSGVANRRELLIAAMGSGSSAELGAQMWLRRDAAQPALVELRLTARPRIRGRVHDQDGDAVEARVRRTLRLPSGGESIDAGEASTDENGAFSFFDIVDAEQRLEVVSDGFATAVLDDVRADAPVDVALEQAKRARIRLVISESTVEVAALEVRVGYFEATGVVAPSWPALGVTTTWSPAALISLPSHPVHHRLRRPEGTWRYEVLQRVPMVDDPRGRLAELQLESGPATISVTAHAANGQQMSRATTGPVTITDGDVELPLALSPTATCRGRILFGDGSERFAACVGLADDAGRLLMISMLDRDYVWESILEVSSHGWFALGSVPVGTWELRVGTRPELERGAARAQQRVVITGDSTEPIILKL